MCVCVRARVHVRSLRVVFSLWILLVKLHQRRAGCVLNVACARVCVGLRVLLCLIMSLKYAYALNFLLWNLLEYLHQARDGAGLVGHARGNGRVIRQQPQTVHGVIDALCALLCLEKEGQSDIIKKKV